MSHKLPTEITTGTGRLSTTVVAAIADREGVDPTELDAPLYEAIDPDALDLLFKDTIGKASFEFHGYLVTVDTDGRVDLTDAHSSEKQRPS